jgi:hypothetical protein
MHSFDGWSIHAVNAFPTQMAWSARSDQDEGLRWIRGCITACVTASVAARTSQMTTIRADNPER